VNTRAILLLAFTAAGLNPCGCILGSDPAPGYPGNLLRTFQCSEYGEPSTCSFSGDGRYGLAVAGEKLLFFELRHGNLMGETELGATAVDMASTPDGGYALVLTQNRLFVVRISGFELLSEVQLQGTATALSLAPDGLEAWILHSDGFVSRIETSSWQVVSREDTGLQLVEGLVVSSDGSALLLGNNGDNTVCRLSIPDLQLVCRTETYNPVNALFKGPDGKFCGIVEGSNEVWFWNEQNCALDYMITVPDVPLCGASMSDESFLYAGIPGTGLVVASKSGEHVLTTAGYGYPADIALESEGWNAILCSPGQMTITILEQ
jgi:hypothetical protein